MDDERRGRRQEQIELAAYRVLERKGFAGATVQAIAREARASNETLYNWYGDKTGLFHSLVARNAQAVREALQTRIALQAPPLEALAAVGPDLLALLTHPRAVALNRAAAADPGGELAQAIAQAGRQTVGPLIAQLLLEARNRGELDFDDAEAALALYLDLLAGDLQHRRVIGLIPAPGAQSCRSRATLALARLHALCADPATRP
ncbi:TetR/AcrR family transcriptional regulator [Paracoccus salsus]|uniref:TetR/AcrR family transcriptional regulator n=1 Tax=Paracoccus salsus TaxID=2911061 RepID=UPI001F1BA606|nr:TetR/AcrR family transcriptional regulator [Paracoccus salsus]MCF3972441.1 TetR/AcrR family transcriptional regulator [Paracoccus salsus]